MGAKFLTTVTTNAPAIINVHPVPPFADYLGRTSLKTNATFETILLKDRIRRDIPAEKVGDHLRNPKINVGCRWWNLKVGEDKLS